MGSRRPVPRGLRELASLQAGVTTLEQANAYGVSRHVVDRLVDDEDWQRLARGVFYCHALVPPWSAWAWAGVLIGGDEAGLGGRAAGHVLGLVSEPPDPITVLIPHAGSRPRVLGPWDFRETDSDVLYRAYATLDGCRACHGVISGAGHPSTDPTRGL